MAIDIGAALKPYTTHEGAPDPKSVALIVVDMQEFFDDIGTGIAANVGELVAAAHLAEVPVVFTRHGHHDLAVDGGVLADWWGGDLAMVGTAPWQIMASLTPAEDDIVIDKHRYSAFYDTDLDERLRERGVRDVVIAGVMTNCCCETTAREAFMRDYRVFVVADATATANDDLHVSSLKGMAYSCAIITWTDDVVAAITATTADE